jgi:hypothetical protein
MKLNFGTEAQDMLGAADTQSVCSVPRKWVALRRVLLVT